MARTVRALAVWANGVRVGVWRLPSRGAMEFAYDDSWRATDEARPLSLSLPLTLDAHAHKGAAVEAYFDNLLPDSEPIRRRLQDRFHAASRGAFDLLAAIGRDCVGAVQLLPPDETPADIRKIDAHPLTPAAIAAELAGVTSTPPAGELEDFRISIAGAQEKTAFLRHQGKWCRPVGSTPTTHIFKLPLGLVGNRQIHLSVARCPGRSAVALTESGPIGVDVERSGSARPQDVDQVIGSGAGDATGRWVRTEARLKAAGHGFARPAARAVAGPAWRSDLDLGEGFVAAVAVLTAAETDPELVVIQAAVATPSR